jgi:hypothetical protein
MSPWYWWKSLLLQGSPSAPSVQRLDGRSKTLLAASIQTLPFKTPGWITNSEAMQLFSSMDDDYASRRMGRRVARSSSRGRVRFFGFSSTRPRSAWPSSSTTCGSRRTASRGRGKGGKRSRFGKAQPKRLSRKACCSWHSWRLPEEPKVVDAAQTRSSLRRHLPRCATGSWTSSVARLPRTRLRLRSSGQDRCAEMLNGEWSVPARMATRDARKQNVALALHKPLCTSQP